MPRCFVGIPAGTAWSASLPGLLTDLPHKTCDTIVDVIAGTSVERLQHLLTDAAWDPLALDEARVKRLLALHPVADGILVLDDAGLPKKGSASVGVFPQYSGTLGKIGTGNISLYKVSWLSKNASATDRRNECNGKLTITVQP